MRITLTSSDLVRVLESLGIAYALCECDGAATRRHENRAFQQLLAREPQRERLGTELGRLLATLCGAAAGDAGRSQEREVVTERGRYRLRAVRLEVVGEADGSSVVLVSVEPGSADPLAEECLRDRFRLTPREAQLARLLAEGKTNVEIAAALAISPNTAHHYTDRVLLKVGARNRAEVGAKILLEPR